MILYFLLLDTNILFLDLRSNFLREDWFTDYTDWTLLLPFFLKFIQFWQFINFYLFIVYRYGWISSLSFEKKDQFTVNS